MNDHKFQGILVTLSMVGLVLAIDVPIWARNPSPSYYAAQLGGGTLAALAGSLPGVLVGGLSGALVGVAVEALYDPAGIYKEITDLDEFPTRPISWAFLGAKAGFGLGVSVGAAWGVVQAASAFGVAGDPQAALIGALAGSLIGMTLVFALDSPSPYFPWRFIRTDRGWVVQGRSIRLERFVLNPITLAALGATIGYNLGTKPSQEGARATVTVPLFALQF